VFVDVFGKKSIIGAVLCQYKTLRGGLIMKKIFMGLLVGFGVILLGAALVTGLYLVVEAQNNSLERKEEIQAQQKLCDQHEMTGDSFMVRVENEVSEPPSEDDLEAVDSAIAAYGRVTCRDITAKIQRANDTRDGIIMRRANYGLEQIKKAGLLHKRSGEDLPRMAQDMTQALKTKK
jgi:hypothetical protein